MSDIITATGEEEIIADKVSVMLEENGLIVIRPAHADIDHLEVDIPLIDELVNVNYMLTGGKPAPLLFLLPDVYLDVSKEARAYIVGSDRINAIKKAEAIVTRSLASTLMVNMYFILNRPPRPAKLFTSEKQARRWLAKFL